MAQYDINTKKSGLLVEYINLFLKFKTKVSGWPKQIENITNEDLKNKAKEDFLTEDFQGLKLK